MRQIKIMMVDSSRKKKMINKDEIINYQYQILEQSTPQVKPTKTHTNKYTSWDLDVKIRELVPNQSCTTRWIGNSPTAYLEAYAYILLIGSGFSETSIVEFKYTIYKLGRKCLDLPQQKLLVEFLCLIEYSRDRYSFLSKYPQIETIFVKILHYLEGEQSNSEKSTPDFHKKAKIKRKANGKFKCFDSQSSGNFQSQQLQIQLQLEEVYQTFNSHFKFINILSSNEYCCTVNIFNEITIHIVIEKDCYFTIEPLAKFSHSSDCFDGKSHMINDLEEIMRDHEVDEEEINSTQDIDIFQTFCEKREDYEVRESSVVPVERASQIRKPSQYDLLRVPQFNSFATLMPPHHPNQFEQRFHDDKIDHDKTFIDDLLTTTNIDHEELRVPESPKKGKKGKIIEKMRVIQEMKDALQQVRERIEKKIKVIDEVQNLKSEVAFKIMQRNSLEKDQPEVKKKKSAEASNNQLVKYHSVNTIKKDRKISYNEPTAFQKKKMEEFINRRTSLKYPSAIPERVLWERQESRPLSKVNSAEGDLKTQLKTMFFSPSNDRTQTIPGQIMSPVSHGNVNVNVNLSINEGLFSPFIVSSNSSFSKMSKFPMAKAGPPSQFYVPPHAKNPRSVTSLPQHFLSKMNNPERSLNISK